MLRKTPHSEKANLRNVHNVPVIPQFHLPPNMRSSWCSQNGPSRWVSTCTAELADYSEARDLSKLLCRVVFMARRPHFFSGPVVGKVPLFSQQTYRQNRTDHRNAFKQRLNIPPSEPCEPIVPRQQY